MDGKHRPRTTSGEKVTKSPKRPRVIWEMCGFCDGCGWYEGGVTIKTQCPKCKGRGKIRVERHD